MGSASNKWRNAEPRIDGNAAPAPARAWMNRRRVVMARRSDRIGGWSRHDWLGTPARTQELGQRTSLIGMRTLILPLAALLVAAACSKDSSSSTGPSGPGNNPSTTTYAVGVDSANAERTVTVGSPGVVVVHVTLNGKAAPGVIVSWKPSAGSGAVSDSLSASDTEGFAKTTWTINDTAKVNTLTAAVGTSSVA